MTAKAEKKEMDFKINIEEMAQAGLHLGHKTSRINPKMKPYIAGSRNEINIIDLDKTAEKLKEALKFIYEFTSEGKILLIVGTKVQVKELVKSVAEECNLPYVNQRWLGGTFTNFDILKKRIEYFKELEAKRKSGELEKYTKKERALFDKEIRTLEIKFGGIKNLSQLPEAILVLDMKKDLLAVKEAKIKGIKVVALANTSIDPTLADYPIPANDGALTSVKYILEKVKDNILKAKPKDK